MSDAGAGAGDPERADAAGDAGAWLRARLRALTLGDRLAYGLALALGLLALAGPPLAGVLDPRLPASTRYHGGAEADRWGRPWIVVGAARFRVRSAGPDGRDEGGAGDDVSVLPEADGRLALYTGGEAVLWALGLTVLVGWEAFRFVRRQLRSPRADLPAELLRAAVLAAPWALLVFWLTSAARPVLPAAWDDALGRVERTLVLPLPAAAAGSVLLLAGLGVLWLRLSGPAGESEA